MENSKFIPSVRYVNGIEIYFKTKHTVQVRQGSTVVNISRWNNRTRGNYKSTWRPFCYKLTYRNTLDSIYQVMNLASKYDLLITTARSPEQPPPDIWHRPSRFVWPAKKYKKKGERNGIRAD